MLDFRSERPFKPRKKYSTLNMCGSGYQLSEGECCGVEHGDVDVEDEYWKKMTPTATLCDGVIVMLLFMMKMNMTLCSSLV